MAAMVRMDGSNGARRRRRSLVPWEVACCCCVFAALTSAVEQGEAEVDDPPWIDRPDPGDLSSRLPVYWAAVAIHAFGLLFLAGSLCTCAHNKSFTVPVALLGAVWFTALDWALPLARLDLFGGAWLFHVVPPGEVLDECSELNECESLDAARAAGSGVLVCVAAVCAPPAQFLPATGSCRLPYGIIPNELEQAREMYVRVQGGDGSGGARSVIKTRLSSSAESVYDWDWRAGTLSTLLSNKQALIRALRSQSGMGWSAAQRDTQYARIQDVNQEIVNVREQRLEEIHSRCIILPSRPTRVRMDVYSFDRWDADQHLGQVTLPSLQTWSQAANCGNFGQRGTAIVPGGPHTLASCQAKCSATTACHTFYHGVESGSEPGQCVLEIGNTDWACLLVPSRRDYLSYSMGTVGAAPLVDQWLNLGPPGSNTSRRCTESPCVRMTVYDELWMQFKIYDADSSGVLDAAELRHMLMSVPAMNYYANADGTAVADEEGLDSAAAEQLASTVEQLLEDHDSDADGAVNVDELETLWAKRLLVETPAYLGTHPLRTGDTWLSVCAGFGVLLVGLLIGGWGNPDLD